MNPPHASPVEAHTPFEDALALFTGALFVSLVRIPRHRGQRSRLMAGSIPP